MSGYLGENPYIYPISVPVNDFNKDGFLDLATANEGSDTVSILLGNGRGGFTATSEFRVGTSPQSIAVGDFNKDGNLDLATANLYSNDYSNNVSVRLGDGTGGFTATSPLPVGIFPVSVAVEDFNKDGNLDLATANEGSRSVSVLIGNGTGGFTAASPVSVGSSPRSVTVGDFDGDSNLDLVTANDSGTVSVLLGNGTGGFTATSPLPVGSTPSAAVGDFNGDGRLDLVTANRNSNNVSLLLNTSTPPNSAPILNNTGNPTLTTITEDPTSNNGTLVSALIASGAGANPITDADAGAIEGIAVTGVDNTNGTWQYSINDGATWNDFNVSATSATVLRDTASDRIRFVPNADYNGSVTDGITFRAWDATDGLASGTTRVNPGAGGGTTPFSTASETASITVTPINDVCSRRFRLSSRPSSKPTEGCVRGRAGGLGTSLMCEYMQLSQLRLPHQESI